MPLDTVQLDPELADRMFETASEFAARNRLDFGFDSLSNLDVAAEDESVISVGAYVGEVIVRRSVGATWGRNGRGDPGVGVGSWLADPFDWVERARSSRPSMPLDEYVAMVVAYAENPSDETSQRLGLNTVFKPYTARDHCKDWVRRRKHRP